MGREFDPSKPQSPSPADGETPAVRPVQELSQELRGDLPCIRCKYNLRGVSVRDNCPECGTPIRLTILAKVDPYAAVLRPIVSPLLIAGGILVAVFGAVLAALLTWALRITDLVGHSARQSVPVATLAEASALAMLGAAVGCLAFVRPHAAIRPRSILLAALGVACFAAAAGLHWQIHARFDLTHIRPYASWEVALPERAALRLVQTALLAAGLAAVRPNARLLASRSLLMRMGRVDRQTMLAMIATLGVTALGDLAHLVASAVGAGPIAELIVPAGTMLIAIGSLLLTVGLVSLIVDAIRVATVVLRPPMSMSQIVGGSGPNNRS